MSDKTYTFIVETQDAIQLGTVVVTAPDYESALEKAEEEGERLGKDVNHIGLEEVDVFFETVEVDITNE